MAKNLVQAVIDQIDASQRMPIILAELQLSSTLRFSATQNNVTFQSNVYTAKAFEVDEVDQAIEGQISRVKVSFGNVEKDMSGYLDNESFYGKTFLLWRVFSGALAVDSNYNEVFRGFMEEPEDINRMWMPVTATAGKPLHRQTLLNMFQRKCNRVFGSSLCTIQGLSDLSTLVYSGTVNSGSTTFFTAASLNEADDFWNYGRVQLSVGGTTHHRNVEDFEDTGNVVTLDIPVPTSIVSGDTYVIKKGCPKTWEACKGSYAYGPSSDNSQMFKGFIHMAKNIDVLRY